MPLKIEVYCFKCLGLDLELNSTLSNNNPEMARDEFLYFFKCLDCGSMTGVNTIMGSLEPNTRPVFH